jgi:DNA-binding MarR family transcriptional regulator
MTDVTITQTAGNGTENAGAPIVEGVSKKTAAAVLENLTAAPGATAAELAFALGMGRSTVTKALTALERAGLMVRTAGGWDGKLRRPDIWACAPTTNDDKEDSGEAGEAATADAVTAASAPEATTAQEPAGSGEAAKAAEPTQAESERPVRLGKGQLRQQVADYLAAHPDRDLGPHQIGKVLGRSSGAVANALDRLMRQGKAQRTFDYPSRYRHLSE